LKKTLLFLFLFFLALQGCSKKDSEVNVKVNNGSTPSSENTSRQDSINKSVDENSTKETEGKQTSSGIKITKNESAVTNITTSEISSFVGKQVILKGYVADVAVREKVAYLNFDKKYPNNTCSVTIFAGDFDNFGELTEYKNKNIEVRGKVSVYNGKAQIIVNSKDKIKVN
jgi:hypothetical protein